MKNLVWILILHFGFTGCLTVKQIERNCDQFAKVCLSDEVTTIVYRDTTLIIRDTIAILLQPDTVTLCDTVTIIDGMAYLPTVYREVGLVWVKAGVNANTLNVSGGLIDTTLYKTITDTLILEKVIREASTTQTVVLPPEQYKTKFTKFCIWWFIISLLAAALVTISKVYAVKLKTLINKLNYFNP